MNLTPREHQIFKLTIQGFSAQKTGQALGISGKTVEFHLTNIKEKAEIYNKPQLILWGKFCYDCR